MAVFVHCIPGNVKLLGYISNGFLKAKNIPLHQYCNKLKPVILFHFRDWLAYQLDTLGECILQLHIVGVRCDLFIKVSSTAGYVF
jgi:hypothetical protein